MPLWDIHCSSELFSTEEKQTLAQQITKIYSSSGIPAFFVRVRFTCDPPDTVFTGGEKDAKFVHVQIWHLARNFTNSDHKNRFLKAVDVILNPFMESKGADWEYTVNESPRDLWKINGLIPPAAGSDMEKLWFEKNRPIGEREKL